MDMDRQHHLHDEVDQGMTLGPTDMDHRHHRPQGEVDQGVTLGRTAIPTPIGIDHHEEVHQVVTLLEAMGLRRPQLGVMGHHRHQAATAHHLHQEGMGGPYPMAMGEVAVDRRPLRAALAGLEDHHHHPLPEAEEVDGELTGSVTAVTSGAIERRTLLLAN